MTAKTPAKLSPGRWSVAGLASVAALTPAGRLRSSSTKSGAGSAAAASSREVVPLRTRIVSSPAARPPSMSEEIRSPTIATRDSLFLFVAIRRKERVPSRAISNRCRSGLPAISARRPEAVSTAARTAPVPGSSPPG